MLHYLQAGEGVQWTPPLPNNQWVHVPPLTRRPEGE